MLNINFVLLVLLILWIAPLGPLELIIVWYLPQKCGNAAMPQSGKNTELNIAFPGSLQALHLIY